MGKASKRRTARHKLRAHDQGFNRHAKGVAFLEKAGRKKDERLSQRRPRCTAELDGDQCLRRAPHETHVGASGITWPNA